MATQDEVRPRRRQLLISGTPFPMEPSVIAVMTTAVYDCVHVRLDCLKHTINILAQVSLSYSWA